MSTDKDNADTAALTDRQKLARHLTREHNASAIARMKFEEMKGWHRGVHTHDETAAFHRRHTHEAAVIDGFETFQAAESGPVTTNIDGDEAVG